MNRRLVLWVLAAAVLPVLFVVVLLLPLDDTPKFVIGGILLAAEGAAVGLLVATEIVRRQREEDVRRQLASVSAAAAPGVPVAPAPDVVGSLRKDVDAVLRALREAGSSERAVRDLPWYLVLGRDGAGRSALMQASGLNTHVVPSEHLEWCLTDRGIFIEPHAKPLFQPDGPDPWEPFLDILREVREGRIVSGVILAVAADDLVHHEDSALTEFGRHVRQRLDAIEKRAGQPVPTYLVVTKLDALAGCAEFAASLSDAARGQVLGFTFPFAISRQTSDQHTGRILLNLFKSALTAEIYAD